MDFYAKCCNRHMDNHRVEQYPLPLSTSFYRLIIHASMIRICCETRIINFKSILLNINVKYECWRRRLKKCGNNLKYHTLFSFFVNNIYIIICFSFFPLYLQKGAVVFNFFLIPVTIRTLSVWYDINSNFIICRTSFELYSKKSTNLEWIVTWESMYMIYVKIIKSLRESDFYLRLKQ